MNAILFALLSACAFAASTVLQHRAATSISPGDHSLPARWVAGLLRHRGWLAGQAAAVAGFGLHGLALHAGDVAVVQPLLSSGLVLALALAWLLDRAHSDRIRPDRVQWAASGVVAVGLALFLLSARPSPGLSPGRAPVLLGAAAGALLVTALAAAWSRSPARAHRSLALGVAAGCGFGVTGLLLKAVVALPPPRWPVSWPTYGLLAVGAVAVVCSQYAYRAGALIESLPAMTVLEPLIAVLLAGPVFGEQLAAGPLARVGELLGLLALAGGVVVLARRPAARHVFV